MKPHKKEKEERAVKREPLREKRRQPRESCAWRRKQKGGSKMLLPLKEIISVCVCEQRKIGEIFL